MSGWKSKETVLQFIKLYQSLPCLWKIKSKEYSNKLARELAYSKIVEFCKQFDSLADKHYVAHKINNLRGAFRKELKKIEASKLSGASGEEVYEPKLWYYPYLLFIKDQEGPGSRVSALDLEDADLSISTDQPSVESKVPTSPGALSEIYVEPEHFEDPEIKPFTPLEALSQSSSFSHHSPERLPSSLESCASPSQDPPQRGSQSTSHYSWYCSAQKLPGKTSVSRRPIKRKQEDEDEGHMLDVARARLFNPLASTAVLDENESFGKTIALLLKNATKEQRIYARKLMMEVMTEAELGNLSRMSYLVSIPETRDATQTEQVKQIQSC